MNKFILSFKDKRLRYGAFSTLTAVFVIAILIAVNLLAGQLSLSYDLTRDKLYSLSERSREVLADIDGEVEIYSLLQTGSTDYYIDIIRELLDEYPRLNSRISVKYVDPYLYPQFAEQFMEDEQNIPVGSVIVSSVDRFKVIPINDLVTQEYDPNTYEPYIASVDVEPQVTNAILYVLSGKRPVIYTLTGHNELPLQESLQKHLSSANYELRELNLFNADVPEDCDLLFITTPERDWSAEELAAASAYLENGGSAAVFIDYTGMEYPNLEALLAGYGVAFTRGLVLEADANNYFMGLPWNIIPSLAEHEITQSVYAKGYPNIVPMAMPIVNTELTRRSLTISPLLTTGDSAYAKINMNSQSMEREQGDVDGPFVISVAVEDNDTSAKLTVTAAGSILDETINNNYVMGANYDYVQSCISWMQDEAANIYISPKASSQAQLMMNGGQALAVIGISFLIPAAIFILGGVVWLRRRNS